MALLGINLLLGLLIALELHFVMEPPAENAKEPVESQVELLPPPPADIAIPPFENYAEIVERPLFNYDRRPYEGAVYDVSDKDLLRLLGIVITSEKKEALFLSSSDKEVVRGLLGDEVEGWEIVAIEKESVTLTRGGLSKEFKLERASLQLPVSKTKKRTRQERRDTEKAVKK